MSRAAHLPFRPPTSPIGADPAKPGEKGRGARSNDSGRYESERREEIDDEWGGDDWEREEDSRVTAIIHETPRTIITRNKSPYVGFDRSINPYRGCEHGCIYCFARPTHAYLGLSPGLDFESRLYAKPDAARLLEKELSNPKYKPKTIMMGTNTDPYQPIERRYLIMRGILSVFSKFNHPVAILTKGALITRDLDILGSMATRNITRAMVSITTQDAKLARSMEPRASAPRRRFDALEKLVQAGVTTGIMTGPMIPGLNDDEMETILEKAAGLGATFSAHTILRLPLEVSPLFQEWLDAFAPTRAKRIMRHIREMNGGRDYDAQWMRGGEVKGTYAKLITERYRRAVRRFGLDGERKPLDLSLFRVPTAVSGQMSLFGE